MAVGRSNFRSLAENPVLSAILQRGGAGSRQMQEAQLIGGLSKGGGGNRVPSPLSPIIQRGPGLLQQLGTEVSQFATDLDSAKKMGREYKAREALSEVVQPTQVGEPVADSAPMTMAPSAQDVFKTSMLFADTPTGAKGMQYAKMLQGQENLEQARNIAAQTTAYNRSYQAERDKISDQQKQAALNASRKIPITSQAALDAIGRGDLKYDPNRSYYTQGGILKSNKLTDLMSPERQAQIVEARRVQGTGDVNKGVNEALNKAQIKNFAGLQEKANVADGAMASLNMAISLNDQSGDEILPSDLQAFGGNILTSIGLDVDKFKALGNVTDGQKYIGLINDQLLNKMQAQKGPQTKEDQAIMKETLANLGNTREARNFLLKSARAINQRDIDKFQFFENYLQEKGNLRGADKAWFEDQKGLSMFGRNKIAERLELKRTGKIVNKFVFRNDFMRAAEIANPDATKEQLRAEWKRKYGRN